MPKYPKHRIRVPRFEESAGFYTTGQRSRTMKKIPATDTKPELRLRRALWHKGVRYRKHLKSLPGKPDIAITRYKVAIFVDGGFWHGHNWEAKRRKIKSNRAFWIPKIERNMQRDREVNAQLLEMGWAVLRFWEHELKKDGLDKALKTILQTLQNQKQK